MKTFVITLMLAMTSFLALDSYSQTYWTGAISNDLTDPLNWDNGLPTNIDFGAILAGTPVMPELSTAYTLVGPTYVYGILTITATGEFTNFSWLILADDGVVINNNIFENGFYVFIGPTATFDNNGAFTNNDSVENEGIFDNCGGTYAGTQPAPISFMAPPDADVDGYIDSGCGGDDCDDNDCRVFPGAAEIYDGVDNDCDGAVEVIGCTYLNADNYDPLALFDDGSCLYSQSCPSDLNGDQYTDTSDLLAFLSSFGTACP
jgi:hypothetical protein